jgi:hypothetical protein
MWKLILFDFDDTLYIKRIYDFIPGIEDLLFKIKKKQITLGIITYNKNAKQILEINQLDHYFDFIISIDNKSQYKSFYLENFLNQNPIYNKNEIINFLVVFESDPNNFEIVIKRQNIWFYMNEIKSDKFMKKYVIW